VGYLAAIYDAYLINELLSCIIEEAKIQEEATNAHFKVMPYNPT
jgi:hypothetical protein